MNNDPEAQMLLKGINFDGFELALHKNWDDVRALDLKALENLTKDF